MLDTETDGEKVPQSIEEADDFLTTVTPDEPEAVAAEPAAPTEGQSRDEKGRFTSTAPQAEPETVEPTAAAPAPEPVGEPAAPAPEAEASEPDEPFVYRADGQEISIPGSAVGEDGVFIPKASLPELTQYLAAGKAFFGSARQRFQEAATQVQAANKRAEAAEAEKQHVLAYIESLIEQGSFVDWGQQVATNWPVLKAEAKAKGIELQAEADRQALAKYREQEQQARMRPLMQQTLRTAVSQFGREVGLDERSAAEVERWLGGMEDSVFVKAPYDDPAAGIKQGETVIDFNVVRRAVQLAAINRPQSQPVVPAPAPKPAPKVPPTVGRGSGAPVKKGIPSFATAKEADDFLLGGNLDEIDIE